MWEELLKEAYNVKKYLIFDKITRILVISKKDLNIIVI